MHPLTALIQSDMRPALGVTEPGAIAFAAAKARSYTSGEIQSVKVTMNSGIYKNAFTCGIPNSNEVGAAFAAALGAVAGDASKGLEALEHIGQKDNEAAKEMVDAGKVQIQLRKIDSSIYICAQVVTNKDQAEVVIEGGHTSITQIVVNGREVQKSKNSADAGSVKTDETAEIHGYTLAQLYAYVSQAEAEELLFIREAYEVNLALFEEGLHSSKTTFLPCLLAQNGGKVISDDVLKTASLLCNGAIEARVIGLSSPAMSITGSGAHGIIATMPLYAAAQVEGYSEEMLLRATALSYLICMYIKEYSGKLSAFCGCAIAAGTGMACALAFLRGGNIETLTRVINNMASSITGMICDGGNQGCTMKGIVAVDAAFRAEELAQKGVCVNSVHGICGTTPEETMRNMGRIASPGMVGTEKTMVEILESKKKE